MSEVTTDRRWLSEVATSDAALRQVLHGLPGVDQVATEARAAGLATRSIKREAKLWALDAAIRMTDLTTLEGADTPGKAAALWRAWAARAVMASRSACRSCERRETGLGEEGCAIGTHQEHGRGVWARFVACCGSADRYRPRGRGVLS